MISNILDVAAPPYLPSEGSTDTLLAILIVVGIIVFTIILVCLVKKDKMNMSEIIEKKSVKKTTKKTSKKK